MYVEYTVQFNKVTKEVEEEDSDNDDGPVVEKWVDKNWNVSDKNKFSTSRQCKKCGHDKMSYKTLQLRRWVIY